MRKLQQLDFNHLWHPFTQTTVWQEENAPIIARGEGFELIDTEGKRYLDGVSSLWCNVHGHSVPELVTPLKKQLDELCHSTLLGLSNVPVLELTEELLKITPKELSRVFYADSGTAAVEAALRIALEFSQKSSDQSRRKRKQVAALLGGYHGDTLGSVGVGFLEGFHQPLEETVVKAHQARPPHVFRFFEGLEEEAACDAAIEDLKKLFVLHGETLAAFIFEPRVQGAAGMWIQPTRYLKAVSDLCKKYEVLLIADEVATGFLKTGKMFAIDTAEIVPDFLVLAKGLSAGYLPISCVLTRENIFEAFSGKPSELKTLFYGQTFAGNPLAARAAFENLKLIAKLSLEAEVQKKIPLFETLLADQIATIPWVDEIRQCGLMVAIELTQKPGSRAPFQSDLLVGNHIVREARARDLIIRPLGNAIVLMPAPAMSVDTLTRLVTVTRESILAVTERHQ